MLCEKKMTTTKARNALLVPQSIKKQHHQKHKVIQGRLTSIA
jgi:hypothetical protein